MSKHFDMAVIGGGPGGYVAALKAGQMGANVALVEKEHLGGTCLNYGCIPSKALLASAELLHHVRHAADLGVELAGQVSANWTHIQSRKDKIIQTLRGGIKALLGARKVTIYTGRAALAGVGKIVVENNGKSEEFSASKTILAVGSVPARIPGWPGEANIVCTSDEALHWKTLPKKLLIVGGGAIGCEFACMMQPLGVEVVIVEMLPQLLPSMDAQVAELLTKIFTRRGIKSFVGTKIENLSIVNGTSARATLSDGTALDADRVLVATGRRPNTAEIGLSSVNLSADRGFVRVNDRMETPVKDYYCIGDANGRCLLAHAASAQGVVAVENALGHERVDESPVPNCVYTFPEIASVGMTAEERGRRAGPSRSDSSPCRIWARRWRSPTTRDSSKSSATAKTGGSWRAHDRTQRDRMYRRRDRPAASEGVDVRSGGDDFRASDDLRIIERGGGGLAVDRVASAAQESDARGRRSGMNP